MGRDNQRGVTLIEVLVVLAITGLIAAPLAAATYQFLWMPGREKDEVALLNDVRYAADLISGDARQADTFTPGAAPDYGTFAWVDYTGPSAVTYASRYYHQGTELVREVTANGSPSSTSLADHIKDYGDVIFQLSGDTLTATVTATIESSRATISRSASVQVEMRPRPLQPAPPPPPLTLAWDDFESGGWAGGSGWLFGWWHEGDSAITSQGVPYQGTYHLRLSAASGYVNRAINLSGRSGVRLQFWAKASSFEAGEFAQALVSPDDINWTVVRTWVDGQDDDVYRFEDIDLSPFTMSSEFWVAFDAQMSGADDYFYVDDLEVIGQ